MPLQPLPRYLPLPESFIGILVVRLLSSACTTMSFSAISPQVSLNGMTNLIRSYSNLHIVVRQRPIASLSQGMPFIIDSKLFSLNVKKFIDRRWIVNCHSDFERFGIMRRKGRGPFEETQSCLLNLPVPAVHG